MNLSRIVLITLIIYTFLFRVAAQTGNDKIGDIVTFACVDPLKKVLREDSYFEKYEPVTDVAKGEHATFQFVVRSSRSLKNLRVGVFEPAMGSKSLKDVKYNFV